MPLTHPLAPTVGFTTFLLLVLCACVAPATPADPRVAAAAQATAMIQQAEATALLLKAGAQATALLKNSDTQTLQIESTTRPSSSLAAPQQETPTVEGTAPANSGSAKAVEITRVSFAGDGAYIYVEFLAPPQIARTWMQGNVSLRDESSGILYNAIPVAPVIGPLIGRPKQMGQIGYVMLVNAPTPLPAGTLVTVTLGNYQKEHIIVK